MERCDYLCKELGNAGQYKAYFNVYCNYSVHFVVLWLLRWGVMYSNHLNVKNRTPLNLLSFSSDKHHNCLMNRTSQFLADDHVMKNRILKYMYDRYIWFLVLPCPIKCPWHSSLTQMSWSVRALVVLPDVVHVRFPVVPQLFCHFLSRHHFL